MDEAQEQYLRTQVKRELRTRMKAVRNATPRAARRDRSKKIISKIAQLIEWQDAAHVMAFIPIGSEVDLRPLIDEALRMGKEVALPRVDLEQGELIVHRYEPNQLVEGPFGLMEPRAESLTVEPTELSLVLVPGLAMDPRGHRVGYGAGYYDRFLPRASSAFFLNVCFDFQLISECPNQPSDVAAHAVITDHRTLVV